MVSILWTIPLVFFRFFGIQVYKITSSEQIAQILNKLPKRSTIIHEDNPRGWIWGWPYIGYILENSVNSQFGSSSIPEVYILTSQSFYQKIAKRKLCTNDTVHNKNTTINIWFRKGNYSYLEYGKREFNLDKTALTHQQQIIDRILSYYNTTNRCVVYLYGASNVGKSMIPLFMAAELNGSYCCSFNPSDAGDNIDCLYSTINPTIESPLVLVLEEVDGMIEKMHYNTISKNKYIHTSITDKSTYNRFFDSINHGFYPFLILIMTSNKSVKYVDSLDPSYLRSGRVDLKVMIDDQKNYFFH